MPDQPPLDPTHQTLAVIFPALGALALIVGIILVIMKDNASLVFACLGSSMALFVVTLLLIGARLLRPPPITAKTEPPKVAISEGDFATLLTMSLGEILQAAHLTKIKPDAVRHPPV